MANNLRLGGIASGMDTESIVKQMTRVKRMKVDAYVQKRIKNEWKQDAYSDVNKSLANFLLDSRKKLGLNNYTYMGKLAPKSIDNVDWAKKAISSDDKVLNAVAKAGEQAEALDVEVLQLAKRAMIDSSTTQLKPTDTIGVDKEIVLNVNGEEKKISLLAKDTYEQAIKKIKNETSLNMSFSKIGQKDDKDMYMFSMSSKKSGSNESISFVDDTTKEFFRNFDISETILNDGVKGQNSKVKINSGIEVENQSNNITIQGLELNLKSIGKSNIRIDINEDEIFNKIKTFVEDYNKLMDELHSKVKEKVYKDYQPLTTEQKDAMKENDIKLWEEKAKSGLLNGNTAIKNIISQVRNDMYEKVDSASSIVDIGITTTRYKAGSNGARLEIDEAKLKSAISKDAQNVLDTLFKSSEDITDYTIRSNDTPAEIQRKKEGLKLQKSNTGAFVKIMDAMAVGMQDIVKEAGVGKDVTLITKVKGNILSGFALGSSKLETEKISLEKIIKAEEKKLSSYENSIWQRFANMEKMIQKLQSQSGWLSQQFGA